LNIEDFSINRFQLCLFAGLPSLAMIERLLSVVAKQTQINIPGTILLLIFGLFLLALFLLGPWLITALSRQKHVVGMFVLFCTLVLCAFYVVYPIHDSGQLGFASDRDEAIDVGVNQLFEGKYPYQCRAVSGIHEGCPTQGNPIAPMPGAMLLASPFVALTGRSAVQNFLWLAVFFLAAGSWLQSRKISAAYLITMMLLAPVVAAEIASGGDLLANSLAVSATLILALSSSNSRTQVLWALLFGVALSWRAHFLLLAVPLFVYHVRNEAWGQMWRIGIAATLAFLLVTLPIYLVDPAGFSPLHIQQKLQFFEHILPHANKVTIASAIAAGVLAAWYAKSKEQLLMACATTILVPILFSIVLNSIKIGQPTLIFYGWYALSASWLGTLAAINPYPAGSKNNNRRSNPCLI
jgi:hypothetical protein